MNFYSYETKIGKIGIAEEVGYITNIYLKPEFFPKDVRNFESEIIKEASKQLFEYFDGKSKTFNLPLKPKGTEFMQRVWKALCDVPHGKTATYKDIAINVGNSKACRAVGMANNKNPIPIVIPCHRIIGTNGKLVGYAGGLDMKMKLLEIEKK